MSIRGATEHYMRELKLNMRYSIINKNVFLPPQQDLNLATQLLAFVTEG